MEDDKEIRIEEAEASEGEASSGNSRSSWRERLEKLSMSGHAIQSGRTVRRLRIALLLFVGLAIGFAVKTEASQRLTIGFQDYMVPTSPAYYDLNEVERQVAEKQAAQADGSGSAQMPGLPGGAACGQ